MSGSAWLMARGGYALEVGLLLGVGVAGCVVAQDHDTKALNSKLGKYSLLFQGHVVACANY